MDVVARTSERNQMTRDYELEIMLLENQLTLMRGSLTERDRVNADLRRQNEWLRERLEECQESSSSPQD